MKTQKINFIVSEQLKQHQQKTDTASEPAASWETIQPIPLDLMDKSRDKIIFQSHRAQYRKFWWELFCVQQSSL